MNCLPHSQLRGTPLYMAPELLHDAIVTPMSDVWAIGVTAYEVATGTHPFADCGHRDPRTTLLLVSNSLPVDLTCVQDVSLKAFLQLPLAMHPSDRPTSSALRQHPLLEFPDRSEVQIGCQVNTIW
eukprot:NODE_2107_length_1277_cov_30.633913_g2004_i0.p3 GENE.NODE_2107_length_1277_cov_30.633913_g2004_i0~~NODE_2107_length_1277_cov_30.633913_g2004_i0.p3  ORF type:complete len:126 (+),score=23.57 NODE_2107_length_1277_cov_30.633913_g2004_i0:834-1211(+)